MKQLRGGNVSIHLGTFLSLCLFSFWGLWSGFLWGVDKEDKIRAFLFASFEWSLCLNAQRPFCF